MAVDVEHPNPTLAPCPFCGNPQPIPRQLGPAHDRIDGGWCIACDALDCGQTSEAYGTLDVAIARWNRRVAPPIATQPALQREMPPEWTAAGLGRLQEALDDPKIEARALKDDGVPDPVDDAERDGYLREAQLQGYRAEFFVETINHLIDLAALERLKVYDVHRERHLAQAREACAASKVDADALPKSPT